MPTMSAMSAFDDLQMAPADPILGLTEAFKRDQNPDKINLTVGVYADESGHTPIFSSVKKAERMILEQETSKTYVGIAGSAEYRAVVQELLFGPDTEIITSKRAATVQTPGGTGGLRVAADFLKKIQPQARIWVSDPTWANHKGIFGDAGLEVASYPYYDAEKEKKDLDFDRMIATLGTIPKADILLLHGSCHNPTGLDPTPDQWRKIAEVAAERKVIPLIDFAYQGFARGIDEDAAAVRLLCQTCQDVLIVSSYSKNFGLYRERVGALTVVCASPETAEKALSHIKIAIRRNFSNPPSHGAAIVAAILNDPALRSEWETEVARIRSRIREMRELFIETLTAKGVKRDFSFITSQNGMFSFSGLNKAQVEALRTKYSIYIVNDGRINVAGMTPANMDRLCQAVADVLVA